MVYTWIIEVIYFVTNNLLNNVSVVVTDGMKLQLMT